MAKSSLGIRQIEGKESALQYEAESETFLSEKDKSKRLSDFISRLSRYKSRVVKIPTCSCLLLLNSQLLSF